MVALWNSWLLTPVKLAVLIYIFYRLSNDRKFKAVPFKLEPSHELTGALAPTNILANATYLAKGEIFGPESPVVIGDVVYVASMSCEMLRIENEQVVDRFYLIKDQKCGENIIPKIQFLEKCCFPLGMRHWKDEQFVLADGWLGVVVVDYARRTTRQVLSPRTIFTKWGDMFIDDFDFVDNETIILTDMSARCGMSFIRCFLEGAQDSRLFQLNLRTGKAEMLLEDQTSLNGVQLHADKQSMIICSSTLSRLYRYYFAGPKKGQFVIFADRLPGLPDNIRASRKGDTYWVSLYHAHKGGTNLFYQRMGPHPTVRWLLDAARQMLPRSVFFALEKFGTKGSAFIEVDSDGKFVSSLYDTVEVVGRSTELFETDTHYYFGNILYDYVAKVPKN